MASCLRAEMKVRCPSTLLPQPATVCHSSLLAWLTEIAKNRFVARSFEIIGEALNRSSFKVEPEQIDSIRNDRQINWFRSTFAATTRWSRNLGVWLSRNRAVLSGVSTATTADVGWIGSRRDGSIGLKGKPDSSAPRCVDQCPVLCCQREVSAQSQFEVSGGVGG
jgi:hypothetical protein